MDRFEDPRFQVLGYVVHPKPKPDFFVSGILRFSSLESAVYWADVLPGTITVREEFLSFEGDRRTRVLCYI